MASFLDLLWLDVREKWRTNKGNQTNWTNVRFNDPSTA